MKTLKEYGTSKEDVYISCMEELPAIKGFALPNWANHTHCMRATAWAYLTRDDGGPFVVLNDRRYFRRLPTPTQSQAQQTQPPAAGEAAHNTPFRVGVVGTHFGSSWIAPVIDASGALVAEAYGSTEDQARQRAAFIVRACNTHAQLVEALESLAVLSDRGLPYCPDIRVVQAARAALAAASHGV